MLVLWEYLPVSSWHHTPQVENYSWNEPQLQQCICAFLIVGGLNDLLFLQFPNLHLLISGYWIPDYLEALLTLYLPCWRNYFGVWANFWSWQHDKIAHQHPSMWPFDQDTTPHYYLSCTSVVGPRLNWPLPPTQYFWFLGESGRL